MGDARSTLSFPRETVDRVARQLFGKPNPKMSTNKTLRFGRQGSVEVAVDRGIYRNHESGTRGGLLDMIVFAGAASDRFGAMRLLESQGEIAAVEDPALREARERDHAQEVAQRMAVARQLWHEAGSVRGTPAERYLREARHVRAPLGLGNLRFLEAAPINPYKPARTAPALVAAATGARGDLTGVHLTYVRPDGSDKADLPSPRKMVGIIGGAHVRLIAGTEIVVGEGIETSFSAWDELDGEANGYGCAAGLSADGVSNYAWPSVATGLIIAFDRDKNGVGERKANFLARRANGAGLAVRLMGPPEDFDDWNSSARARGRP